jgi:hypothetical protein
MKKLITAATLAIASLTASAMSMTDALTLTNVTIGLNAAGTDLYNCNTLALDLTGDLARFDKWNIAGVLMCGGNAFNVSGSGFLSSADSLFFTVNVGLYRKLQCNMSTITYTGPCTYINASGVTYSPNIRLR